VIEADRSLMKDLTAGGQRLDLARYAAGLRTIDMTRCPQEFQMTYLEHIQAWEDAAKADSSMDSAILGGLIALFAGGPATALPSVGQVVRANDSSNRASQAIHSTWHKVERVALSYGVSMPRHREP